MLRLKSDFYEILFAGGGNSELQRLVEVLRRRITLVRVNSLSIPGRPRDSLREIQGILEALVNRDPIEAQRRCVEHIRSASEAVLHSKDSLFFGSVA